MGEHNVTKCVARHMSMRFLQIYVKITAISTALIFPFSITWSISRTASLNAAMSEFGG